MSTDDSNAIRLGTLIEVKQPPDVVDQGLAEAVGPASEDTVGNLLAQAMPFLDDPILGAIVPWFCDKLGSDLSIKDYRRDLASFWLRMKAQGIDPLAVTGDHVRIYKKTLDTAGARSASISRYLSVIRGVYQQLAIHGQVRWDVAQDIQAIEGPVVQKNSTPALTSKQAQQLLDAIPTQTLKGKRDRALMWTYINTACRVSAIIRACVGDLNYDGVDYRLQVTEKRKNERNIILLEAAGAVLEYIEAAGVAEDFQGPLFRPAPSCRSR